jgi:ABC-type nitrate/sulfonate/bicarbonate transport system substrate-binding protein
MTISKKRGVLFRILAILFVGALIASACGSDDDATTTSDDPPATDPPATDPPATDPPATDPPATDPPATDPPGPDMTFPSADRCQANRDAGKMIFITGFDFVASVGILDIVAAEAEGYYDDMCIDVEIQGGFSPGNSASVAAGASQFASVASFGEMVRQNVNGETDLVAFAQLGHTSIAVLVVPDDGVENLADLEGLTMGIKGDIPTPVEAMLEAEGLSRGTFTELLLDGFDPVAHLELGIDALPVFRSNEPATLDDAGVAYRIFDPLEFDVPSSFGVHVTSRSLYEEHPTVVEDFMRASIQGFEFADANPEAAVAHAFELINAAGNQFFLAEAHELDKWAIESAVVRAVLPAGLVIGELNPPRLGDEVQVMTDLGVFDSLPDWESMTNTSVVPSLYDGDALAWESMNG